MKVGLKLRVNRIQCNHCGDIIESEYEGDTKRCSCGAVGISGGKSHEYRDCSHFPPGRDYSELSILDEEIEE